MHVDVVTPWYPSPAHPYRGSFVRHQVVAMERLGATVEVEVPEVFPAPRGPVPPEVLSALHSLAETDPGAAFPRSGRVTRVPSPVPTSGGALERAGAFRESLRIRRLVESPTFDIVHAHLGVPTGLALMDLSTDPLVVTEHQSALPRLLSDQEVQDAYRRVIDHAAAFITVSETLRSLLIESLGASVADRIQVIPNIIDFASLTRRDSTPTAYRDWLYVGTLAEHKGVAMLLDAFQSYATRHDSEASLTLVGDGPMRGFIESSAADRGLARQVKLTGAVPHDQVASHLTGADVLIHLSPFETFGIAPLEAIASGTPVVVRENQGSESAWGDISSTCGRILDHDISPEDVADVVAELRDDPGSLDFDSAHQVLVSRFSAEVVGGRLLQLYGELST